MSRIIRWGCALRETQNGRGSALSSRVKGAAWDVEAIARWQDVRPEQVTVGCGSVGLLRQLAMAYIDPGDEAIFPWISFEAYPIVIAAMGGTAVRVPLTDHVADLGAVADAVTDRTRLILLATPNNPTGTALSTPQLGRLLDHIPDDVVVLVDEAYREFADPALGDPVRDLLPRHRNLVVFRTFSKAHGLAGLRCGYAVAVAGGDPQQVDRAKGAFKNALAGYALMGLGAAINLAVSFGLPPGIPWSVKGIEPEAREAAKLAARRSGMTLGEWLNSVIFDQSENIVGGPTAADSNAWENFVSSPQLPAEPPRQEPSRPSTARSAPERG